MKHRLLNFSQSASLMEHASACGWSEEYQFDKHQVIYTLPGGGGERIFFRLPIQVDYPFRAIQQDNTLYQYLQILVESGVAAVGYFENGENIDHKVFRAYMVRKKQGMSQIKYLKTKGKSRAGSRVRLAETAEFFSSIRERVNTYFKTYRVDRIAISCSLTLWPYLFGEKGDLLFSKYDPRIYKVPMHVPDCTYENLRNVHKFLMRGELKYGIELDPQINTLLTKIQLSGQPEEEEDSW